MKRDQGIPDDQSRSLNRWPLNILNNNNVNKNKLKLRSTDFIE